MLLTNKKPFSYIFYVLNLLNFTFLKFLASKCHENQVKSVVSHGAVRSTASSYAAMFDGDPGILRWVNEQQNALIMVE